MNTTFRRFFKYSTLWLAVLFLIGGVLACQAVTGSPTTLPTVSLTQPSVSPAPFSAGPIFGTPLEAKNALHSGAKMLEELAEESYNEKEFVVGQVYTYTIHLDQEEDILWNFGYLATNEVLLSDNLQHIEFKNYLNDAIVDNSKFYTFTFTNGNETAQISDVLLRHWPTGTTTLKSLVIFKELVNNGERDYSAGVITFIYKVIR